MNVLLFVVAVVAVLAALDRLLLAAEARGWIYWRRRQGRGGFCVGAAVAGELGAILSPAERARQEAVARAEDLPAAIDLSGLRHDDREPAGEL